MECIFCNRQLVSLRSKQQHQLRCKLNPNAIVVKPSYGMLGKRGSNQFIYAKENGLEIPKGTQLGKIGTFTGKFHSEETKQKMSNSIKLAIERNPEAYTSSNRGRTKQILYDGIKFQGNWELEFYKWCKHSSINIQRTNESFDYMWNGNRKYFPDFYLPEYDTYVEVKGYETDRDHAKWSQFAKKLIVIRKKQIEEIRKGILGPVAQWSVAVAS